MPSGMGIPARLALAGLAVLLLAGDGVAQRLPRQPRTPDSGRGIFGSPDAPSTTPSTPSTPTAPKTPEPGVPPPGVPTVRIGALLPLTGAAAWFGKEMRQAMELAIADLNRPPGSPAGDAPTPAAGGAQETPAADAPSAPASAGPKAGAETSKPAGSEAAKAPAARTPAADAPKAAPPATPKAAASDAPKTAGEGGKALPGEAGRTPDGQPPKAPEPPREAELPIVDAHLVLDAADVHALDVKQATSELARLAAARVPVVFTASATPTVAVHALAATHDVLLIHQGMPTGRLPVQSRTLLQARPSLAGRTGALLAHARERGIRRLAVIAAGDDPGKAVRAELSARWRDGGASLVLAESFGPDAPDLAARLRQLVRLAPDGVLLGFRGAELGEMAAAVRRAGYRGPLLALDDDRGALLAAGGALDDAAILTDAFVPEPDSRAARFAAAYTARFGSAPSRYAANAYDAVVVVAEGLRAARSQGHELPGGRQLREALLAQRGFPSLYGGRLVLRDDGTLARPFALFTVERGALTFVRYVAPPAPG